MLIAALFLAASGFVRAAEGADWLESPPEAFERALREERPVLMDFQAPWCYSCYYMEQKVLSREPFRSAAERLVLLRIDVDRPEGRALKEKNRVTFLPTYVLADGRGRELGRIVGEQTEADLLARLRSLSSASPSAEEDRAVEGARRRLASREIDEGLREAAALAPALRKSLQARRDWPILAARLELMRASGKADPAGAAALRTLLRLENGCDLAYDVYYAETFVSKLPEAERRDILEAARTALELLAQERVFAGTCADFRTGIDVLADVLKELGQAEKRLALLRRAARHAEDLASKEGLDRNRDDNLRYFLELSESHEAVLALYPRLVEAYPSDYVYAYRFARYLDEQGRAAQALPWIERASRLAYGANRMQVGKVRAKILASLGRKDEARKVLRAEINGVGKAFPKDADSLRKLLGEIR